MTEATPEVEVSIPPRGRGRPKAETIALTKAARARFDTLAAGSIEAVFQAVLTAATQDGDMAAAKLIIDRVIPSRRGAPVSFHIRPLKTPEDCALAYADLLDDVGTGRLTPEEAQTISAIVAKRAELFASIELASEIEALKAQLAAVVGAPRPPIADPPPVRDHLRATGPQLRNDLLGLTVGTSSLARRSRSSHIGRGRSASFDLGIGRNVLQL